MPGNKEFLKVKVLRKFTGRGKRKGGRRLSKATSTADLFLSNMESYYQKKGRQPRFDF